MGRIRWYREGQSGGAPWEEDCGGSGDARRQNICVGEGAGVVRDRGGALEKGVLGLDLPRCYVVVPCCVILVYVGKYGEW